MRWQLRCTLIWRLKEFFDFIALSLKEFIERKGNNLQRSQVKGNDLGFTFSFSVRQMSVSSGTLIKWTKGFAIDDMVGKDVECLQQTLSRRGPNINVAALKMDGRKGQKWIQRAGGDEPSDARASAEAITNGVGRLTIVENNTQSPGPVL